MYVYCQISFQIPSDILIISDVIGSTSIYIIIYIIIFKYILYIYIYMYIYICVIYIIFQRSICVI